jgi:hypothetical protein
MSNRNNERPKSNPIGPDCLGVSGRHPLAEALETLGEDFADAACSDMYRILAGKHMISHVQIGELARCDVRTSVEQRERLAQ